MLDAHQFFRVLRSLSCSSCRMSKYGCGRRVIPELTTQQQRSLDDSNIDCTTLQVQEQLLQSWPDQNAVQKAVTQSVLWLTFLLAALLRRNIEWAKQKLLAPFATCERCLIIIVRTKYTEKSSWSGPRDLSYLMGEAMTSEMILKRLGAKYFIWSIFFWTSVPETSSPNNKIRRSISIDNWRLAETQSTSISVWVPAKRRRFIQKKPLALYLLWKLFVL